MRSKQTADEVRAFLARVPHEQRKIIATLRRIVRRAAPEATESVLWESLSYHRANFGGRIKGAVCLITPKADGVHLCFIHGAAIADPHGLLRGERKAKRFVPIRSTGDIREAALTRLIKAAATYDPRQT